jgi:hypothetical protein
MFSEEKHFIILMINSLEIKVKVGLTMLDTRKSLDLEALLDCSTTGLFIDREYVEQDNLMMHQLPRVIPVYNVDGTPNSAGSITHEVDLWIAIRGYQG